MRALGVWVALLTLWWSSQALAIGYTASITTAFPALTINPSAPQVAWYGGNCGGTVSAPRPFVTCDDGVTPVMPIGFSFNFAGTTYTNWSMSSNGVIFFETGAVGTASTGNQTFTPRNLPSTALGSPARPALMPFWADLQHNASAAGANNVGQPANASFYQYEVLTRPSGAQVLVVQLKNVTFWNSGGVFVNMQIQLWSTGQIVYSYGNIQATTAALRIGLQSAGGTYCHTLASSQTTGLSNQSFVYEWDPAAVPCAPQITVNHYEIRHDGAATQCAEPVALIACSSATSPCPAASILRASSSPALTSPITARLTVTGAGVTSVAQSPPSVNILPSAPSPTVNLNWAAGSAGTATLGVSASVAATGALRCTDPTGTSSRACTMAVSSAACVTPPHHFEIQGPASGSSCTASTFTIRAWADAAKTVPYTSAAATGTLIATGNPASIPSLGAFTIPAGSSSVSISPISFPSVGTTTFSTSSTPALAGPTTCRFGSSTACTFVVASCVSDFNCVESTSNAASAADSHPVTGRLYTKRAGTAFGIDVVARNADGSVATTYASDGARSVTVELVNGAGATACAARSAVSPAISVTQNFVGADAGRKSYLFTVPEAHRDLRCRVTDTTTTPAIPAACSVDNFVIRPSAVTLSTSANAAPPPAPNAASASPVVRAGSGFTLQASTATGSNYAGVLTLDSSRLSAQTTVQATTVAAGGTVGLLTPPTLTTNPITQPTGNATYSEVGFVYLAAGAFSDTASPAFTTVDNNASGDCIAGSFSDSLVGGKYGCNIGNATVVALGRFVPDHFHTAIVPGAAPIACPPGMTCPANASGANGLLYSNQPFSLTVTARNAIGAGSTTSNYQGVFAKAHTLSAWSAPGVPGVANPGAGTLANPVLSAVGFAAGSAVATPRYALASPATAPVNVHFRTTDADGIGSLRTTGSVEAGLRVASGRILVANAHGSERLSLPIIATVQYFNGSHWLASATDNATSFNSALVSGSGNVVVTIVDGLGNGLSVVNPASASVIGGRRTFTLAAPMASGNADITLDAPSYLPGKSGRATFGIFKSPIIYGRENF
jgi:hypothetical protein